MRVRMEMKVAGMPFPWVLQVVMLVFWVGVVVGYWTR